jgi:cyanophycinase
MEIVAGTSIEVAIRAAYRKGGLISGTSAGAAVMSSQMITGNELKHPEYASTFKNLESDNIELKEGLGMLSGIIIDQHFVRRSRYNRLISAIIEYPELIGIGIDESTAILVQGSRIEVVGESQVIVLTNPGKSQIRYKEKIGAEGLSLNIYLPGAIFNINRNDQN